METGEGVNYWPSGGASSLNHPVPIDWAPTKDAAYKLLPQYARYLVIHGLEDVYGVRVGKLARGHGYGIYVEPAERKKAS